MAEILNDHWYNVEVVNSQVTGAFPRDLLERIEDQPGLPPLARDNDTEEEEEEEEEEEGEDMPAAVPINVDNLAAQLKILMDGRRNAAERQPAVLSEDGSVEEWSDHEDDEDEIQPGLHGRNAVRRHAASRLIRKNRKHYLSFLKCVNKPINKCKLKTRCKKFCGPTSCTETCKERHKKDTTAPVGCWFRSAFDRLVDRYSEIFNRTPSSSSITDPIQLLLTAPSCWWC